MPKNLFGMLIVFALPSTAIAQAPPSLVAPFSKQFIPNTIGPGSVSTLRFDIANPDAGNPLTDLAFTDNLPAGVVIATPANASSTCGGTLSAPDGGGTITFSDGTVAAGGSCSVFVNVTSSTPGIHTNVSGDLTSSLGNLGNATADLTVDVDHPGFSKSFSPSSIPLGSRSTLTFLIDNQSMVTPAFNLDFSDQLPAGLIIANPANGTTDCDHVTLMAAPGADTISLSPTFSGLPSLGAPDSCTVSVDVVGTAVGQLVNLSGDLTSAATAFGAARSSGLATAALQVTAGAVHLIKEFTDDPVLPGGTATLQFTIQNRDRDLSATDIAFMDDLDATLSGLAAIGLPAMDVCGAGSQISGAGLLSFTGGSLGPGESCTFSVTLQVPVGAAPGEYPNITTAVTADLGGSGVVGNQASDSLFVNQGPTLSKAFAVSTAGTGETVTLNFTITNNSSTSAATDIAFNDNFSAFLGGDVVFTSLPPIGFCGAGSSISTTLVLGERILVMTGGNLAADDFCNFSVDFIVPLGTVSGPHVNTTDNITATVDGMTQIGNQASDTLEIAAAPLLSKSFTDDPVLPGATVTLEFTLDYGEQASSDATGISFTDDLNAVIAGLAATGLPMNDVCGAGSQISGTTTLSLTGGVLAPGTSCTFSVTLQVPAGAAPGSHTNTTSDVTATVGGVAVTGGPASDDLQIAALTFSKAFTDDPVIPGDTVTLEFTITNVTASDDATDITFQDFLNDTLSGLQAMAPLPANPCGAGSTISGTSTLTLSGGNLTAGTFCTFSVTLLVPGGAADGDFLNATTNLVATISGTPNLIFPGASDVLSVSSQMLQITKSFTDDPVMPGDTVTLEFTITNLDDDPAQDITFTDDLDAVLTGLAAIGLPAMNVCGAGSQISGAGVLTLTGGNIPGGSFCTFSVTLQVPAGAPAGTFTNTTGQVSGIINDLPVSGPPASDDLVINLLTFSKAFLSASVPGSTVTLRFMIENLSTTDTASGIGFTDDLNAVIAGLAAVGLPANNVCGAGSQLAGTTSLALTAGELAALASCTFDVTLQVPLAATPGSFNNTTSQLFLAGLPAADPATDALIIEPPPLFSKSFSPNPIAVGGTSTLTFTINNTANTLNASSLNFTDNLPASVVLATPPSASTTCSGGTITALAGASVFSYSGGTVLAGTSCTVQVNVSGSAAGMHLNTSGDLTSSSGNSGTASDTLTVNPPPAFSKSFSPDTIPVGGVSTLTFTIDNTSSTASADSLDFTDNLPAALQVANPANASTTCSGGTLTAASGSSVISYSGGSVAAASSCTISVDVTSSTPGAHLNTSGDLTSSLGNSGTASDTLTVDPAPVFSKLFDPNPIAVNGTSILTFTIDNTASTSAATGLAFSDDLPAGVTVGTPANASTTCSGGTLTAAPGSSQISYSGGTVAAGSSCQIQVDVSSDTAGMHVNTSSDLTSSLGTSAAASDTLNVIDSTIVLTKSFNGAVLPGGFVEVTYTLTNTAAALPLTDIAFSNDFDAVIPGLAAVGLPASDVCGAGSTVSGTSLLSFSGGSLAGGASCSFSVTLQVPAAASTGSFACLTSDVTATAPGGSITGPAAAATLTILFFDFSKAFSGEMIPGSIVTLTFMISNPDLLNGASDITFSDDLNAVLPGLEAVGLPQSDVCGIGSQVDGTSIITLTGGVLGPGESCSFGVQLQIPSEMTAGTFTNVTSPLEATVGGETVIGDPATAATAALNVELLAVPLMNSWGLALLAALMALVACWRLVMR